MKKLLLILFISCGAVLVPAQNITGGTANVTVVPPTVVLYGSPFWYDMKIDISGVTGTAPVGLGGFVLPVGYDSTKFEFISARSRDLPGTPAAGTLVFVNTDPTIAATNGWFSMVAATSGDTPNQSYYIASTYTGRFMNFGTFNFDVDPAGLPAQNVLSLSSKWTSANGGPASITPTSTDLPVTVSGKLILPGGVYTPTAKLVGGDYDGDGKSDLALIKPESGNWYRWKVDNSTGADINVGHGQHTDIPVPADYNGDGVCDLTVARPNTAGWLTWIIKGVSSTAFGLPTDVPVPGDYDGDGSCDFAVARSNPAGWIAWHTKKSTGGTTAVAFGAPGNIPVPADYDGDGICDPAVVVLNPAGFCVWKIFGSTMGKISFSLGNPGDIPVASDFNGDGTCEPTMIKSNPAGWLSWKIYDITTATATVVSFGKPDDIPCPLVYDADAKADRAVYRPSTNTFIIRQSTTDTNVSVPWGAGSEICVGR